MPMLSSRLHGENLALVHNAAGFIDGLTLISTLQALFTPGITSILGDLNRSVHLRQLFTTSSNIHLKLAMSLVTSCKRSSIA